MICAPAGTPKDIVQKFNAKLVEIAKSDEMIAKMRAINVDRAPADARGSARLDRARIPSATPN